MKFLKTLPFLSSKPQELLTKHYPVMYREVAMKVQQKCTQEDRQFYLMDCTFGSGAHSEYLLEQNPNLNVIGLDIDENMANQKITQERLVVYNDNFINYGKYSPQLKGGFDIIFADLGYNIHQIQDSSYGLSYKGDDSLDMRYSKKQTTTATAILNNSSPQELREIFMKFGQINKAATLTNKIVEVRKTTPIDTAEQLVTIINDTYMRDQIPQIFQALRIAVNQEIKNLEKLLQGIKQTSSLRDQLILIITFHSLETDAIIKFTGLNRLQVKNYKITKPGQVEIQENPRSRSAKLIEFIFKGQS